MLDLKVQTFLTVCQEMNFTRAARRLHLSQPAVTQHIHSLEEYYHAPLFEFEGKRFRLTKYGRLIHDTLLALKNNENYLMEQLDILKNHHPVINMGATLTAGEFLVAKPISRYLNSNPDTELSLTVTNTRELLQKLDDGIIDFAILEGDFPKSAYAHQPLFFTEFIPVCCPSYKFTRNISGIHDLTGERLIIREQGSGTRSILETELDRNSLSADDFRRIITIGNMNAIIDMVAYGCGITFLYRSAVEDRLKDGSLTVIPLKDFHIYHEISAVWKKENLQGNYFAQLVSDIFCSDTTPPLF